MASDDGDLLLLDVEVQLGDDGGGAGASPASSLLMMGREDGGGGGADEDHLWGAHPGGSQLRRRSASVVGTGGGRGAVALLLHKQGLACVWAWCGAIVESGWAQAVRVGVVGDAWGRPLSLRGRCSRAVPPTPRNVSGDGADRCSPAVGLSIHTYTGAVTGLREPSLSCAQPRTLTPQYAPPQCIHLPAPQQA